MRIIRFFFLLLPVVSCDPVEQPEPAFVTVTNSNEYDIIWVAVIDAKTGYPVVSERGDKLIEKGGSKTFKVEGEELPGYFAVCVKAENASDLVCTAKFALRENDKRTFTGAEIK